MLLLCPHCRHELPPILPEFAGQTIACPHCGGAYAATAPSAARPVSIWVDRIKITMLAITVVWLAAVLYSTAGVVEFGIRERVGLVGTVFATFALAMIPTIPYAVTLGILAVIITVLKK